MLFRSHNEQKSKQRPGAAEVSVQGVKGWRGSLNSGLSPKPEATHPSDVPTISISIWKSLT